MKQAFIKRTLALSALLMFSLTTALVFAEEATNGCEKVVCPSTEESISLPNPDSCNSFCKCDWGKASWFACPEGLHFNAALQVCDWPDNAKCELPEKESSESK